MTAFAGTCYLWRSGDTKPIFTKPAAATLIKAGDLLFQHPVSKKPVPAASMVDQGSATLNQDAFQQFFLGVALQESIADSTDPIAVATEGVFEFDCVSATPKVGDMFGAAEQASGTALENKKLATAANASRAISRCVKDYDAATTKIWVEIRSTIMHAGVLTQVEGSSSNVV